ncbi:Tripeptidyl-peptidase sed1 [Apiospora rasikravindrae]|uniref:Tripeptidyl-peptidase sed1 n=1 Tax=Apiospora rasikravindrae TaxID=990691 RepID=A0ABR1RXZ0_9PEZI
MLIHSLVTALATGLILETVANPVAVPRRSPASLRKREIPATHNLHERHVPRLGQQWTKRAKVHSRAILPMRIGLKQSNLDAGHDRLMDISNPQSANYGKHMSSEEVIDFFAPQQSSVDAVIDWVVASGISRDRVAQSVNKQWIQFDATAAEAESLLFAEFHVWQHNADGTRDISTESYHVPSHVQEHVDYVTPGTRLRKRSSMKGGKDGSSQRKKRAGFKDGNVVRPAITKLPGFPNPNATTCDIYVTAECTRGEFILHCPAKFASWNKARCMVSSHKPGVDSSHNFERPTTCQSCHVDERGYMCWFNVELSDRWLFDANHRSTVDSSPIIYAINGSARTYECVVQYNLPNGTTSHPGNELGIFESLDDHYSRADLDVFFSTLYPYACGTLPTLRSFPASCLTNTSSSRHMNIPNGTYPEERLVDGAVGAFEEQSPELPISEPGSESALDFDSAWPLIWPQRTVLYQVDDEYYEQHPIEFSGFWNTFLDAIDGSYCTYSAFGETGDCTEARCRDPPYPDPNPGGYQGQLQCGVYKPTNVVSISYGGSEYAWPDYYMKRQCKEWMKLALQGTTVVISSGDDGVGPVAACPRGGADNATTIFAPDFASTCPYVLAVGSTEWDRHRNSTTPKPGERLREVATARFASGGGFSNIFATPEWQRAHVSHYVEKVGPTLPFAPYGAFPKDGDFVNITHGVYNSLGRAYPDVAAVGDRQVVYTGGSWYLIGGTSLSAPVWGAILTLVNEERLKAGKSTVGFINPILYSHPEVFFDVTAGSNPGCGTSGFTAAKGWDPVTGLGSPNFPKLLDLLMSI